MVVGTALRPWHDGVPPRALRAAAAVLVLWAALAAGVFTWAAPAFLQACTAHLRPPASAPSIREAAAVRSHFAFPPMSAEVTVVIESEHGGIDADPAVADYENLLYVHAEAYWRAHERRRGVIWVDGAHLHRWDINGGNAGWMVAPDKKAAVVNFYYLPFPTALPPGMSGADLDDVDALLDPSHVVELPPSPLLAGMPARYNLSQYVDPSRLYRKDDVEGAVATATGYTVDLSDAGDASGNLSTWRRRLTTAYGPDILTRQRSAGAGQRESMQARVDGFLDYMEPYIAAKRIEPGAGKTAGEGYKVTLTGGVAHRREGVHKSVQALQRMEVMVLPCAFLVLWYYLRHLQLLVVPLVCVACSAGTAFALCLPIAAYSDAVSFDTPEIILSTCVALSLDYGLFLLTRYLEATRAMCMAPYAAVVDMLTHTGHTISVSAVLIAAAFFASALIPIPPMRYAGLCLGVTALAALVTNVTVVPAVLVVFGRWLAPQRPGDATDGKDVVDAGCADDTSAVTMLTVHDIYQADEEEEDVTNYAAPLAFTVQPGEPGYTWYRLASGVRRHPWRVICAIVLASLPLLLAAPRVAVTTNRALSVDRHAESTLGWWAMDDHGVPGGRLHPALVAVHYHGAGGMLSAKGFAALHRVGDVLGATLNETVGGEGAVPSDVLLSPAHVDGEKLSFAAAKARLADPSPQHHRYRIMCGRMLNGTEWALVAVFFPFNALGEDAAAWTHRARAALVDLEAGSGGAYTLYLETRIGPMLDASDLIVGAFPAVTGALCAVLVALVGVIFRSALIPLRLLLALGYTLAITLGTGYVIYQTDAFHWLFPWLAHYRNGGLDFVVPAILLPVCIALGLDYDIFLISRIIEIREQGVPDADAIVMGVARTGSTISGAGVIMAIAFGGLMASGVAKMAQFGALLVVSVVVDTFLIRTILVPALMFTAAEWNWWPRQMPPSDYRPLQQDGIASLEARSDASSDGGTPPHPESPKPMSPVPDNSDDGPV
eukprot:TRINITY_DN8535_c0_g1_i1.p1 TRINITY_DN8535_c0_g1~~TRINITY_DN8535_c0_g1_i1.p1  ORF type:complete len:1000 (+),score=319.10 TRINITY_DN8535_c0_g1_i1:52-3051(+)